MSIAQSIFAAGRPHVVGSDILSAAWDAVAGAVGYKLYRRSPSGSLTFYMDLGNVTTAKWASPGQWHYAVTAYNAAAQESEFSNELFDAAN
jgi:hypothetical protein